MADEIHYEIFLRRGAKASWSLEDVLPSRDKALKLAKGKTISLDLASFEVVRVVKLPMERMLDGVLCVTCLHHSATLCRKRRWNSVLDNCMQEKTLWMDD